MLQITDGNTTYLLDCPSYDELITYYNFGKKERARYRAKSKVEYAKKKEKKLNCKKLTDEKIEVETTLPA